MKVKTLAHADQRETTRDIFVTNRNLAPNMHPFERQREYTRALTQTKLARLFAAPFVANIVCPSGIQSLFSQPNRLVVGCDDGSVSLVNLVSKKTLFTSQAHKGFVKVCGTPQGGFISAASKLVKIWSPSHESVSLVANSTINNVDHHQSANMFATCSSAIELWDHARSTPVNTFQWGAETITHVRFNKTETNIMSSCGSDRTVILYDIRTSSPISKSVMAMQTNAICWNPMEAFNFTTANEDHNCYTFDMRNLKSALCISKGHVSAVLALDYSPTGQEFATSSYDKTIRIFNSREGKSREIYHTQRMQRFYSLTKGVGCSVYSRLQIYHVWQRRRQCPAMESTSERKTRPGKFVLIQLTNREKASFDYSNALQDRFKNMPQIRRIANHRHIPKPIAKATSKKHVMLSARKTKVENRRKHSAPGAVPYKAERKIHVLNTEE